MPPGFMVALPRCSARLPLPICSYFLLLLHVTAFLHRYYDRMFKFCTEARFEPALDVLQRLYLTARAWHKNSYATCLSFK